MTDISLSHRKRRRPVLSTESRVRSFVFKTYPTRVPHGSAYEWWRACVTYLEALMTRLAVDTGGTFTDAVFFDDQAAELWFHKAPSTPGDYAEGLLDSLEPFADRLGEVELFVHGTTVCLNAILQGKIETTGFITTRGFRDILELQRSNRTKIYDPMYCKPAPLVPRHLRFEVNERVLPDGQIAEPLDEQSVIRAIERLKSLGVRTIGVCLLNSYANDIHEATVVKLIRHHHPQAFVTRSTELSREYREYERSATAAINAGLMPIMRTYLESLEERVRGRGLREDIHIMQSNGGMMTSEVAHDRPVYTINSGLVGGVIATHTLARLLGEPNAIGSDMGGTSFDVSLIVGDSYRTLPQMRITTPTSGDDAYPLQMASLDTHAIGAGGGSIAWADEGGLLHVGPQSAGADPGPASYGRGGTEPTITDANLVLGRLNPDLFLGGRMNVYPSLARAAIEPLAEQFGQSVEAMAEGILTIAVNNMANAIRTMTIRRGIDPREFILAFGRWCRFTSLIAYCPGTGNPESGRAYDAR